MVKKRRLWNCETLNKSQELSVCAFDFLVCKTRMITMYLPLKVAVDSKWVDTNKIIPRVPGSW